MALRNRSSELGARVLASVVTKRSERSLRSPFFLVGSPRSGTTLLARLLASHPQIATYPYEANELWHPRAYPWHLSRQETPPIWVDPYGFTEVSCRSRTERDDRRLKAVFGAYQLMAGGKCFLNKSVMITFMLEDVVRLFPDARFVHIVRDGRAVALSYAHHEYRKIERSPQRFEQHGLRLPVSELVFYFARFWKTVIAALDRQATELRLRERSAIHELRYEDFCASPTTGLVEIARFMGVKPDRFSVKPTEITNMNYKLGAVATATLEELSQLMKPELNNKGYYGQAA